jgi:hypothetical protein
VSAPALHILRLRNGLSERDDLILVSESLEALRFINNEPFAIHQLRIKVHSASVLHIRIQVFVHDRSEAINQIVQRTQGTKNFAT